MPEHSAGKSFFAITKSSQVRVFLKKITVLSFVFGPGLAGKNAILFLIGKTLELSPTVFHVPSMKVKVTVMPKQSVLDPQGVAVREAIHHHGMPGVKSVRIGKFLEIEVDGAAAQEDKLHELCRDLLSNPVI